MADRNKLGLRLLALGSCFTLAAMVAPGCSGLPGTLCDLVCECEHCNDVEEDVTCEAYKTQQDIAEIYDCAQEWEDWATCVEEKGTCDDKESDFSTRKPGSCSGAQQDTGLPCVDTSECLNNMGDPYFCSAGTCQARTCSGDQGGFPCSTSAECPDGEDRCSDESADLNECIDDASDMNADFD